MRSSVMGVNGSPGDRKQEAEPSDASYEEALRSQQEELRVAQDELSRRGRLLNDQAHVVDRSQREVREKSERLSELSMYRPGFLADMSHDLRAPLNTILILAEQLEDNTGDTMTEQQVEYATVIRSAGTDLLRVINGFLDVAKVESGTINADQENPPAEGWKSRMPVRRRSHSVDIDTFHGVKVFLVDDEFKNIFAMKALLERGQAIVSFAERGEAAVEMLKSGLDVDIVLLDIRMPGMDGYDTLRAIRKIERCKNLPLIVVTAEVLAGERQRCLDAGANDYLPKPVDTSELVKAISPWLPTLVAAIEPWR
jgi:CheY-like chemotaxis protein